MERKKIKDLVFKHLNASQLARDNDNYLIARVLEDLYNTTDIRQIALLTNEGICESITRQRRLIQKNNPFLASSDNTTRARRRKELEYRESMRKEI